MNTKFDETKSEVQKCQQSLEDLKADQSELKREVNELKTVQYQQNLEIGKLDSKFSLEIERSRDEMRQLLTESLKIQQVTFENDVQQSTDEILNNVSQKLRHQEHNFDKKIDDMVRKTQFEIEECTKSTIQDIKNEILPKINIQNKLIETHQAEIQQINESISRYENEVKLLTKQPESMITNCNPIQVICTGSENNDRLLPKFNGRASNPNEYLRKLKRYYERNMTKNNQNDPIEYLIDVLENSFEGPASRWLQLIKNDIDSWDKFSEEFMAKYWSREVQRGVRAKIESEKYRNNGTLSRTEYFTERVLTLQSITPAMTDEEIVILLSERFDSIIQDSLHVQNITKIRDFERLLQKEDIRDGPKRARDNNRSHNQNSRPSTPNSNSHQNYQETKYNHRAYQPKVQNPYQFNQKNYTQSQYNPNNNRHNPYARPNQYSNSYNYHPNHNQNRYQNQPYSRNQGEQRNPNGYNQRNDRPYPTAEQNQVCAVIRQNPANVPPTNTHPEPSRIVNNSQQSRQGNDSAL